MLYLEDYLEMIENLPMEMRDRFTDMREMDLQVQNAMDSLDERVKTFFKKCHTTTNLKQDWKDEQMEKIKQDYYKALEDADENVQLANQIYEMVDRHLRKLDQELQKFKMELEADNAGITERLEKRSLELDNPPPGSRPEKRKHTSLGNHIDKKTSTEKIFSTLAHEAAREAMRQSPAQPGSSSLQSALSSYSIGTQGMSTKSHISGNTNPALAAAASQAIAATQQKMQQGRRTSSLKASIEAMTRNADLTKEFSLGKEGEKWSTPSPAAPEKPTKKEKRGGSRASSSAAAAAPPVPEPDPVVEETPTETTSTDETNTTWAYDPNEPRYCICNEVSYGDMIGCDNEDCPIEWFHYGCVGLTQAPKGKWYCPECTAAMKRRGRK